MKNIKIENPNFRLIGSTLEGYKEVRVVFNYRGKETAYFIFIKEGKNVNYVKEAKKRFQQELKDGTVAKVLGDSIIKSHPRLAIAAGTFATLTVVFGSLFAYKLFNSTSNPGGGGGGDIPSDYIPVIFNAGKGGVVEGAEGSTFKYYVKKGTTYGELSQKVNKIATKDNEDFVYWIHNGEKINDDYLIEEEFHIDAAYRPIREDCLTLTAHFDATTITFDMNNSLEVSTDGDNWYTPIKPITLEHKGDQIYFKRKLSSALSLTGNNGLISSHFRHSISGPIESLINGQTTNLPEAAFKYCFAEDRFLVSASNLKLGNITLSNSCFSNLFYNCEKLVAPPKLPAIQLTASCYDHMFYGCKSLTHMPQLSMKELADHCCDSMFTYCTSLTTVPDFSSDIVLAPYCFYNMFLQCTGLVEPPALPAQELQPYCYSYMFSYCYSLTKIPDLKAKQMAEGCYSGMFAYCSSLATVPDFSSDIVLAAYCFESMFTYCNALVEAPELPDSPLEDSCYKSMFMMCENLSIPPHIPTYEFANACYENMFMMCNSLHVNESGTGTPFFTCPPAGGAYDYSCMMMFAGAGGDWSIYLTPYGQTYYYE